jgi:hypothetical protein
MGNVQSIAQLMGVSEDKLIDVLKQFSEEKGAQTMDATQRVTADIKQNKGEIKGFPNTDVSAPAGKHPVVPGLVKTEGMPLKTIDESKPGEHLKSDAPTKEDPDKRAVDSAGGLTRHNQEVLMASAAKFDVEAAESTIRAKVVASLNKLTAAGLEAVEQSIDKMIEAEKPAEPEAK